MNTKPVSGGVSGGELLFMVILHIVMFLLVCSFDVRLGFALGLYCLINDLREEFKRRQQKQNPS